MKRLLFISFLFFTCFALTACNDSDKKQVESKNDSGKTNWVKSVNLTDREMAILATTTSYANVFDFKVDDSYSQASVWVEKFVSGKEVKTNIGPLTTDIERKGSIIFTTSEPPLESNEIIFEIGIHSEGSTSSSHNTDMISKVKLENKSSMIHSVSSISLADEELVLATICLTDDQGMTSIPQEFYEDMESHLDVLKEYDIVYVLKAKFKE
ncbi:hypothetical protein [Radiobacillus deserti]|uniref:YceI family protein n=1 Tax=Radiobacillus deserti TaxID=2594883 RepID=A0A516KBL2_9BACI|nr:hypothetical protein [Radiobacillus deserti]QDP38781.1 hypothetical protein FN924_00080 [Radiobacillus deserti]